VLREVAALFPDLPRQRVQSLPGIFARQIRPWKIGTGLFAAAAALALLLASIGLYSVVAFGVRQRQFEFGIRRALGAEGWHLLRLVFAQSLAYAAAGLTIGLGFAVWGGRFVGPLLFEGNSPRDPAALAAAGIVLLVAALAASVLPALSAARADPRQALQAE
jgi:ABC-type antimicrobial peptide transport system permease subunit